eukprot:2840472-Lingulodinium_polyedra.AAC.1
MSSGASSMGSGVSSGARVCARERDRALRRLDTYGPYSRFCSSYVRYTTPHAARRARDRPGGRRPHALHVRQRT